jgi:hypothetical protein
MTGLEGHYRRLIALYPVAHRQRYQMEMLSTLMDGASENQRAPRIRESIDLLWNAIWLRLNRDGAPPLRDSRWAAAAAIFGPLGALVIAGLHLMVPLGNLGWMQRLTYVPWPNDGFSQVPFVQGAAWLAVAVVALLGWRRIAALMGWATVLATVAWAMNDYLGDPTTIVKEWTLVVFGVMVAGCLSLAKGRTALSAMHVAVFGGVTAACTVSLWVDAMIAHVEMSPDGNGYTIGHWGINFVLPGIDTAGALPLMLFALFLAVSAWLQYKVDAGVRRRLRAYVWVPLVTWALVRIGYTGFMASTMRFWPDRVLLTAGQWLALILVPLAVLAIGVIVVRRKDSQQRLIEIGRAHS